MTNYGIDIQVVQISSQLSLNPLFKMISHVQNVSVIVIKRERVLVIPRLQTVNLYGGVKLKITLLE